MRHRDTFLSYHHEVIMGHGQPRAVNRAGSPYIRVVTQSTKNGKINAQENQQKLLSHPIFTAFSARRVGQPSHAKNIRPFAKAAASFTFLLLGQAAQRYCMPAKNMVQLT
jgi:hypothetical protein